MIDIRSQDDFHRLVGTNAGNSNFVFKDIVFWYEVNFVGKSKILKFENCTFKESIILPKTIDENISFSNSIFEKNVNLSNIIFKYKVRFYSTKFLGTVNFNNTKFDDLADFWSAKFYKPVIFYKTDFYGTTVFSSTIFKENVLFSYSLINKIIIFRNTKFEKGLDLSLAIISGEVSIFNIKLIDFKDIIDTDDSNEFDRNISENAVITSKNKRETFRIIKNQLIRCQNNIDALKYYGYEMKAYTRQLNQDLNLNKDRFEVLQNIILLKLNWLSNRHSSSWINGVIFTFIVGIIFFYASLISTYNYKFGIPNIDYQDFTNCFKYFFTSMLPTHNVEFMKIEKPTFLFYIWDFLGRIFISYGIYQTIQAFRKYKNR